ncbi:MAG: flagellar hook-length control protein FliK [Oceanicoccus sp.]
MNSTGQGLDTNPLLASTLQSSQVPSNSSVNNASSSDNVLNTKEFSDVMDKQQATEKVAAASQVDNANSDGLTSDVPAEPSLTRESSTAGSIGLAVQSGLDGNLLPADGESLPPAYLARGMVSEQHLRGFQAALDTEGNGGDVFDSDQSGNVGQSEKGLSYIDAELTTIDPQIAAANPQSTTNVPVGTAAQLSSSPDLRTGFRLGMAGSNNNVLSGSAASLSPSQGADTHITAGADRAAGLQFSSPPVTDANVTTALKYSNSIVAGSTAADLASSFNAGSQVGNNQLNKMLADAGITVSRQSLAVSSTDSVAGALATSQDAQTQISPISLAALDASQTYKPTSAEALLAAVPVPVGKPGWSDAVMQRVMWMSSQNINRVDIALDPPELGPLQVRIVTQADQTSVVFSSNHGSVREALDQGLPRLREMMDSQGLNLTDVNVSDQSANRQQQESAANPDDRDQGEHSSASGQVSDSDTAESLAAPVSLSLVDQYV